MSDSVGVAATDRDLRGTRKYLIDWNVDFSHIKAHFPLASLEEKDAIIKETEVLLRMAVVLELLVTSAAPGEGIVIINHFQGILTGMIKVYEQEYIPTYSHSY